MRGGVGPLFGYLLVAGAAASTPAAERDAGGDTAVAREAPNDIEKARGFWSFGPLSRPQLPEVKHEAWSRTPIDRFILAKLEAKGLLPNPQVSNRKLIRRAYFDLIGLPPTPEAVEAFVGDNSPDAYEKLIDRLLASPHYGERWGRHWLDVARFAESHGFEHDYDRKFAYYFRDFVIRALNQDMPYDRFVRWQLAGDELEPANPLALMATGFLGAGVFPTQITKNEVERTRYDAMDDMAATMGTAMLGLTIGCARCHDHKFDPIPTRDYYRLVSTFTSTVRSEIELALNPEKYKKAKAKFDKEHAPLVEALRMFEKEQLPSRFENWVSDRPKGQVDSVPEKIAQLLAILDEGKEKLTDQQRAELLEWYRTIDPEWQRLKGEVQDHIQKKKPELTKVMISTEGLKPMRHHSQGADFFEETHFLNRGDPNQKQGVARQSFLQVLMTAPEKEKRWQVKPPEGWRTSYRRTALANWITDTEFGAGHLLARVIVNRLWYHHIGRGIVATPNDFGSQGERPTHAELLDWLATELVRGGWRLKPMHKLIMTSAVYMQSTEFDAEKSKADPDNVWCWRRSPRRLEAEVIRDNMLALSGTLDRRMFGPGRLEESHNRRSVYFTVKRSRLIPTMQLFDAPQSLTSIGRRPSTTTAPQALMFLNNPNVRRYARNFAKRLSDCGLTVGDCGLSKSVRRGYMIALGRTPTEREFDDSIGFLKQQVQSYSVAGKPNARELALANFCQVLMSLNEFIYIE